MVNCPSAPILQRLFLKQNANPTAIKAKGVAFTKSSEIPYELEIGEIKKVYNLDDIVKFNENSPSKPLNKKIRIVTNSIPAVQAIKEMEIVEGEGTILLIFNGKTIKIGEKFLINDILTEKLRNIPEIESVELCQKGIELPSLIR